MKIMISGDLNKRENLFINYATENSHLAEWLTLKLTSEGYKVWCDRFKLLGGESYPKNITEAIKNKTFRFIALLSKHSIDKPNPLGERTLALQIGRERNPLKKEKERKRKWSQEHKEYHREYKRKLYQKYKQRKQIRDMLQRIYQ